MAKNDTSAPRQADDGSRVPAVERAFAIIRLLADRGPLSLADVVSSIGLNKSTIFYILRTLVGLDVVAYDELARVYALGPALVELGITASGQFSDVDIAKRNLAGLLEVLNGTIVLYRRVGAAEMMLVDKLERADPVRLTMQVGIHLPIAAVPVGPAFLAFDDQAGPDGRPAFGEALAVVRRQGWAADHEGFAPGVSTVAAPIFGPDGKVALVAAAVGFTSLFTEEMTLRTGARLRAACDRVGALLGDPGAQDPSAYPWNGAVRAAR